INKDQYVVMSLLLLSSVLLMVGNLLSDIALAWVDSRMRYDRPPCARPAHPGRGVPAGPARWARRAARRRQPGEPPLLEPERRTPLQLAWRRFRRSRSGMLGAVVLVVLYLVALFSQFLAPYSITRQYPAVYQPPQRLHFFHDGRLAWPFAHPMVQERDPVTF